MLYTNSRRAHYNSAMTLQMLLLLGLWISNAIIGCQTVPLNSNSISSSKFISNENNIRPDNIQLTTTRPTTNHNYNEQHSLNLINHGDFTENYDAIDEPNYDGNYAIALGAPLLLPRQEDIVLEMQDDFTLKCEDNEPIIWKYPLEADVEEETYKPLDKKRRFGKMLILRDLSYLSVGNYYCIKSNNLSKDIQLMEDAELVDLTNNNLASSIYVFVNDTDNLLAPMTFPVIHVMQFQDATIPCKPSAPNVEVILTTPMGKTLFSKDLVRYDPRLGFVIALRNVSDTGLYICRPRVPSLNNEDEQTEIELLFGNHNIDTYTTHVDKPNITSSSRHHAYVGDTFKIICIAKIAHDVRYRIDWKVPEGIEPSRKYENGAELLEQTGTHTYRQHTLTVKDAKLSDTGIYTCKVQDHSSNQAKNSYNMIIMEKGTSYINISEPNDYYVIKEKANKTIQMTVRYSGFPWPTLTWYGPNGNEILPIASKKYNITTTDISSTLKIMNPRLLDSGTYIINATNGVTSKSQQFNVSISDVPIVTMRDVFVQANEKAHVVCHVVSHPVSIVTWVFEPCSIRPRWPSCNKTIIQDFNETTSRKGDSAIEIINDLYFVPKTPGIIRCKAENKIGFAVSKAHVLIRDIDDNMTITGIDDNDIIARGDQVIITCAAVAYYYVEDLLWFKDDIPIEERDDIIITNSASEYSYKKTIVFTNIQDNDQGLYECRAKHINDNKVDTKYINIYTYEPSAPRIIITNMGSATKIERKLGDLLELICESEAIPRATVTWYKDDIEILKNTTNNQQMLVIPYIRPEDEGQYKCVVSNRLGSVEETVAVKITNMPGLKLSWIMGILFILLILIVLVIYLCIRVNRERRLLRELKAAGLANFEEGAVEHINPALTLDEQADLLPYDRGFEFSRDKLKLGKQLGAGAFGVVLKAHAEGIRPEEKESVVAVKMVKRNANNEVMRALVSELKIMVHLGQHLNVVNLLGAVTKNIAKRELMVIVEYCRYGNVQNFLLRNRKRFINQINPVTGKIDPTIMTQRFSDNFELNRNSDNDPRSGTRAGRPNSTGYITQSELYEGQLNTCATEQTVMTTIPEDDDNNIMSNNSIQPAWRSNYKPDSTEAMSITTTDLISWAFQVACGMEYLSSKKVLHGDLAARNILLCEDNIVKICDFGLARSMYKNDNYKKQGEAPLPIKWLALESLSDHIFSTYTDVWSYGIVLWEFFSLAKVPYPGMDPNQSLYLKLKDGYRMEKPPYANDDLYDIMLECWSTNPERRPLFNVLKEKFAAMLGEEVTNHYVDLNEPYLKVNSEYMKTHQTDYLAIMGVPDEMAPAPPARYINGHLLPEIHNDNEQSEGHTEQQCEQQQSQIQPQPQHKQQFSPTIARNMNSPLNSKRERLKKDGIEPLPEEIPMLANVNYNLYDVTTNQTNNDLIHKYPNYMKQQQSKMPPTPSPRHHIIETKLANDTDNYVNLKSPKLMNLSNNSGIGSGGTKGPEAFSNPGYQILKTIPDTIVAQHQ